MLSAFTALPVIGLFVNSECFLVALLRGSHILVFFVCTKKLHKPTKNLVYSLLCGILAFSTALNFSLSGLLPSGVHLNLRYDFTVGEETFGNIDFYVVFIYYTI